MTAEQFRQMALALPDAVESAHMNHPDFRVSGRIFATLGYPGDESAVVKLTPPEQKRFVRLAPATFAAVNGVWGRRGATKIDLPAAKIDNVREALLAAWRNTAPKRLRARADSKANDAAK